MYLTGPALALFAVLAAIVMGAQTYAPFGSENALGIALGAGSTAAMSMALILSTRPKLLEPLFGGLDRMYQVHKWLGIAALALMLAHNSYEPDLEHFVRETRLGHRAEDVGEWAFNGLIGLILLSWFKRIPLLRLELPWAWWRFTHRFTGALFALVVFHVLAIDTPADTTGALHLYLKALCFAGILAWLFTWVAPQFRRRSFVLDSISRYGSITELRLQPENRPMQWQPGQFAFVSAAGAGMGEPHPFTIAGAPERDGSLRFGIKALGRWTAQLPDYLQPGQRLQVEGPYGRFVFRKRIKQQVWLAGGIGITPFLAWAEALQERNDQHIVLVWMVACRDEAFAAERLAACAARYPQLEVHIVVSAEEGRLTAQKLVARVPFSMREAELFYCGPEGLRKAIEKGLKAMGQSPKRIHYEEFELR